MIWQAMMSSSPWGCLAWAFLRAAGSRTYGPPFGRFRQREVRPGAARALAAAAPGAAAGEADAGAAVAEGAAHEHGAGRGTRGTDIFSAGVGGSVASEGRPSRAERRRRGVDPRKGVSPPGPWHWLASGNRPDH